MALANDRPAPKAPRKLDGTVRLSACVLKAVLLQFLLLLRISAQEQVPVVEEFQSSGKTIHMERFSTSDQGRHPAVFLIYGAAGVTARGDGFRDYARDLANHGYVVFLIHCFDATDTATAGDLPVDRSRFTRWTKALRDGIAYAGKDSHVDRHRIALLGFSLGAFLALWESSQDSRVKAVVEYYGGTGLFMGPPQRMPPTLILHGEKDSVVSVEEARKLERLMDEQHAPYEIKIYPNQGHGFDGPEGDPTATKDAWQRTLAFFSKYLVGK
jgi:carboxymethylenebutenolidase